MRLQDWGEEKLIAYIAGQFSVQLPVVGIGDDCAVIPGEGGKVWLVATDALVEGVHFLREEIGAKDLGYKTVAVNVSDIAAMGGEPKYALLSIAIPGIIDCDWVREVIQGIKEGCDQWGIDLLGGDTTGSKRDIFLNLVLLGSGVSGKIQYREGAQLGDIICVTGYLGDAGGGLKALQEGLKRTKDVDLLLRAHFHPQPDPKQGLWLASQKGVHAMMDISDGLDSDLKKLLESSRKGAAIEMVHIPISCALNLVCAENTWDQLRIALTGGEEYCLLLTIDASDFGHIEKDFREIFGSPLFAIGRVTSQPGELIYQDKGSIFTYVAQKFCPFL